MNLEEILAKLETDGVHVSLAELIRYKGLARQLNLKPASAIRSSMAGGLVSKFKGRGMEFDEARHYQAGDDIRSIDWRVTARTGKTHTKLYREERERPVIIFNDLNANMYFGSQLLYKSVQSLHCAAAIAFSAISRGDKVGCMAINRYSDIEFKPKGTSKHVLTLLNELSAMHNRYFDSEHKQHSKALNQVHNTSLTKGLSQLSQLAKPGTLVYLISDFVNFNEECFDIIGKLQSHCEVKALQIMDPIDLALPSVKTPQVVQLSDGEQDKNILLGDTKVARDYQRKRQVWASTIQTRLHQTKVSHRLVSAAKPLETQLQSSRAGLEMGVSHEPT